MAYPKKATNQAFIFFNCDEAKSPATMNPMYNSIVFKDTKTARTSLWNLVKEQMDAGSIKASASAEDIEREIMLGNPVKASDMLQFGAILCMDCY